ncbi:unnamed protein product, partial [Didymodactylos carnosus]
NIQSILVNQLHWMENEVNERFSEFKNDLDFQQQPTKSVIGNSSKLGRSPVEDRIFLQRNSLLTDLFEVSHIRSIRNIFSAILILFISQVTINDLIENGRINLNFELIFWCFGKLHVALFTWLVMQLSTAVIVYLCFYAWATNRVKYSNRLKLYDITWLCIYVTYLIAFFVLPCREVVLNELPVASALVVLLEQLRQLMKAHAFVRENTAKVLAQCHSCIDRSNTNELDSTAGEQLARPVVCPNFSQYLYFLFAPTLIYRDLYPRNSVIHWDYVLSNFGQVLAAIFYVYYVVVRFCVPTFSNLNTSEISVSLFASCLFNSIMPGCLFLLLGFYGFLHCWLNAFAEMLRFSDRMFYKLCGYRRKSLAAFCVVLLSAIVHEYVMIFALGFFYPVMFVFFGVCGIALLFLMSNKNKGNSWNIMMWVFLLVGIGFQSCLYFMEWYARRNCPQNEEEIQSLQLIYGDEWYKYDSNSETYRLKLGRRADQPVELQVTFVDGYPYESKPKYSLYAPSLRGVTRQHLTAKLEQIVSENLNESIIYRMAQAVSDFLDEQEIYVEGADGDQHQHDISSVCDINQHPKSPELSLEKKYQCPMIITDDPTDEDRASVFQAHMANIEHQCQIQMVLDELKKHKKIANAKHNVYAYRIMSENGKLISECNDDGENRAGEWVLEPLIVCSILNNHKFIYLFLRYIMSEDWVQLQVDEIEALNSIYSEKQWKLDTSSDIDRTYELTIDSNPQRSVSLDITFCDGYPTLCPPKYNINAPWLRGSERQQLTNALETVYLNNANKSIVFLWAEKLREFVDKDGEFKTNNLIQLQVNKLGDTDDKQVLSNVETEPARIKSIIELPPIYSDEAFEDRRSTFQAHLAPVHSKEQVSLVLAKLKENKKIANATHNIYAYRIWDEKRNVLLADCDDDGETDAASRMLHLMDVSFHIF